MLQLVLSKDEYVVHMAENSFLPFQDLAHSSLKMLWGAGNAKWQLVEAIAYEWCDLNIVKW